MSPFSYYLHEIRRRYGISQRQLAARIGYEPAYISGLELNKKGPPNEVFLKNLIRGLGLNEQEACKLYQVAEESKRRYVLPENAQIDEYIMVSELWMQLGRLSHSQISIIREVLKISRELSPTTGMGEKQEAKM